MSTLITLIVNPAIAVKVIVIGCTVISIFFTYKSTEHITYRQQIDYKRKVCERVGGTYKADPDQVECGYGDTHDPVAMLLSQTKFLRYSILFQTIAVAFSLF